MAHPHQSHFAGGEFSSAADNIDPAPQSFERSHEFIGIQSGMEMLGVPSKHHNLHIMKGIAHQDYSISMEAAANLNKNLAASTDNNTSVALAMMSPWQPVAGLFPGGGDVVHAPTTEQSNGRLSLSLYNNIDLYPHHHHHHHHQQQQHLFTQEGRRSSHYQQQQQPFEIRNSKYLAAAQELLNECCSLRREIEKKMRKSNFGKGKKWEEEVQPSSSSSWNQSLYYKDVSQLQEIKVKLLDMLEEIDRRYRKYREQMSAVVASFEAVAGEGTAEVYSALAAEAMSRHFRCLRDSIVTQIRAVKGAMGEKDDNTAAGTTRGETPRLKMLDRRIRQQKLFHQGMMMEQHPWRPQRGLPERAVSVLRAWLFEHFLHPYPNEVDKIHLAKQSGLTKNQVSNWFINARVRLWKPMVEEMYLEEMKEFEDPSNFDASMQHEDVSNTNPNPSETSLSFEEKPFPAMQLLNDPESLSSMLNISHRHGDNQDSDISDQNMTSLQAAQHQLQRLQVSRADQDFGYSTGSDHIIGFPYNNDTTWNEVSLTLGLQQHNGGMSLSFPSGAPQAQTSFMFTREHIRDDSGGGGEETLSYGRNFMGTQFLDDLAG